MSQYTLLALDLAHERVREAESQMRRHQLAALAAAGRSTNRSFFRRPAARLLAGLSLGSAAIVRRLDECIADDLGRSLAPTE